MDILIAILTIILVLVSVLMIFIVLMQRGSAAGGLGAAMGGGVAESAFGAETSNVLTKATRTVAIVFFVLVFGLYLGWLWLHEREMEQEGATMPQFEATTDEAGSESAIRELMAPSEAPEQEEGAGAAPEQDANAPE